MQWLLKLLIGAALWASLLVTGELQYFWASLVIAGWTLLHCLKEKELKRLKRSIEKRDSALLYLYEIYAQDLKSDYFTYELLGPMSGVYISNEGEVKEMTETV